MDQSKKMMVALTALAVIGLGTLVHATGGDLTVANLFARGHVVANGDVSAGGDLIGLNNASINGGLQVGSSVNASDYTGTIFETQSGVGNTCSNACNKWSTQSAACVEALDGAGSAVSCSGTVPSGNRYTCLCKT